MRPLHCTSLHGTAMEVARRGPNSSRHARALTMGVCAAGSGSKVQLQGASFPCIRNIMPPLWLSPAAVPPDNRPSHTLLRTAAPSHITNNNPHLSHAPHLLLTTPNTAPRHTTHLLLTTPHPTPHPTLHHAAPRYSACVTCITCVTCVTHRGNPLYPMPSTTRLASTITAPTCMTDTHACVKSP